MKLVIQRVSEARVEVRGRVTGSIGHGLLVLAGFGAEDDRATLEALAKKMVGLRIFRDAEDKMNLALGDVGGGLLVVSQFTLYADCRKGRRPSFINAAPPEKGKALYEEFLQILTEMGHPPQTGEFGAMMDVHLINDGPVTIWLDSAELLR